MTGVTISTRVLRTLEDIEDETVEYDKLLILYNNATKTKLITEIEREFLTQRIEMVMRKSFPKQSGRVLGNKNDKAVKFLEGQHFVANHHFDLSDNLHKNGVKVGGDMIGGRRYLGWYISYKNRQGWGTSLAYRQKEPDTEPYLEVRLYQVGSNGEHDDRYEYRVWEEMEARTQYMSCLALVDCPQKPNSEGVIVDWEKSKQWIS